MFTILRMPEIIERIGISRAQVYALISCGEFPRPIRIGKRAVGWMETDIQAWINARPLAGSWSKGETLPHRANDNRIPNCDC